MLLENLLVFAAALIFIPQIIVYIYYSILAYAVKTRRNVEATTRVDVSPRSISIILPVRREPVEYLENALLHIHSLGIEDYEVIIVSDDPEEEKEKLFKLVEALRSKGVNVWIAWRSEPRGFRSGALNTGLFLSRGDYVYVLDVDSRPTREFFRAAFQVLRERGDVAAVVGRWEPLNEESRVSQALAFSLRGMTRILYSARSKLGLYTYPLGTGTLYRADLLKSILGGWDEERIQDDMELGARILGLGYRVIYLDEYPVYVENPETYRAFRIQQSRWAYGALDAAIARFKHIFFSKVPLVVKFDAFFYLLQYLLQALVFTGTLLAATMTILGVSELSLIYVLFTTWLVSLILYSTLSWRVNFSYDASKALIQLGRMSAMATAISPYVAYSTIKALLRVKEAYKRTPKGVYERIVSNRRIPWELVFGILFATTGLLGLIHGWRALSLWLLLTSTGYFYVVYRFPRDVFYE